MIPAVLRASVALRLPARRREEALTALTLDGPGRIHSLYRSSVNLLLENGCFCTLFSPREDGGPGGIILAAAPDFTAPCWGLERDLPIWADRGRLTVGTLQIDAMAGEAYSSKLLPPRLPFAPLEARRGLQRLEGLLDRMPPPGSATVLEGLLEQRTQALVNAFRAAPDRIAPAVEGLVGLGLGLTPSGDDILTGCLAGLWYCLGPGDVRVITLRKELARCADRTTFISARMLRSACEGRFRISLQRLVEQVFLSVPRELQSALEALLGVGATSGRDMALGVLCACRMLG